MPDVDESGGFGRVPLEECTGCGGELNLADVYFTLTGYANDESGTFCSEHCIMLWLDRRLADAQAAHKRAARRAALAERALRLVASGACVCASDADCAEAEQIAAELAELEAQDG